MAQEPEAVAVVAETNPQPTSDAPKDNASAAPVKSDETKDTSEVKAEEEKSNDKKDDRRAPRDAKNFQDRRERCNCQTPSLSFCCLFPQTVFH